MVVGLFLATAGTYFAALPAPFLFDDEPAILANPSIRDLTDLQAILWPDLAGGVTTSGRPLLNLTFAIDHALWGLNPAGYRATNLLVHACAAWVLFSVVTGLLHQRAPESLKGRERIVAAGTAFLWLLHPLQTNAVSYIAQRAESLCALFYLLTIYFFGIYAKAPGSNRQWPAAVAILTSLLGMATKEVMVTAPFVIVLLDRCFFAGTWSAVWRLRRVFHVALASTGALLVLLVWGTEGRGDSAGVQSGVSVWHYALTQCDAITRYLRLALWPSPLIFDYGTETVDRLLAVAGQAALLAVGVAAALAGAWRGTIAGTLGLVFFVLLAPSSSIVPIATQTVAEHRMYLPLAVVTSGLVVLAARFIRNRSILLASVCLACTAAGVATIVRNRDYASAVAIWSDTVAKRPTNTRGWINLAKALEKEGRAPEAMDALASALERDPRSADAHFNRAVLFAKGGQRDASIRAYDETLRINPTHAEALNNLGTIYLDGGSPQAAIALYERAAAARPRDALPLGNLSIAFLSQGRHAEAIGAAQGAVEREPTWAEGFFRLGNALREAGRTGEAVRAYEKAATMDPTHGQAYFNLANLYIEVGRFDQALDHYRRAFQAEPSFAMAKRNAGLLLARQSRYAEAFSLLEEAGRLDPSDETTRNALAELRREMSTPALR